MGVGKRGNRGRASTITIPAEHQPGRGGAWECEALGRPRCMGGKGEAPAHKTATPARPRGSEMAAARRFALWEKESSTAGRSPSVTRREMGRRNHASREALRFSGPAKDCRTIEDPVMVVPAGAVELVGGFTSLPEK